MERRELIKTFLYVFVDAILLGYIICVMAGCISLRPNRVDMCSNLQINISENVTDGLFTSSEIRALLDAHGLNPIDKPVSEIDTRQIETFLRQDPLIEKAECYISPSNTFCIDIVQRTTILHVMSDDGRDYYLDNTGKALIGVPYVTDIIVATGKISPKYSRTYLKQLGNVLVSDNVWKDMIEQVHVLPSGDVELVPHIGNHIIYIGKPVDVAKKLERLRKFYVYGLNKIGWDKYDYISVEFLNQIICRRHHNESKIESAKEEQLMADETSESKGQNIIIE